MFDKVFDSFKDNFSQKSRNPFLATILTIWIFRNWRLVYGLFTFDEKTTQKAKIAYISNYFKKVSFYEDLFYCIGYAFGALVITYCLLGASRFIIDLYDNIILPRIKKITDPKSIVDKMVFDEVVTNLGSFEKKLADEREARIKAQNERDSLESRNADLFVSNAQLLPLKEENEKLSNKVKQNEIKIIELTESHVSFKSVEQDYFLVKNENEKLKVQIVNFKDEIAGLYEIKRDREVVERENLKLEAENIKLETELNDILNKSILPNQDSIDDVQTQLKKSGKTLLFIELAKSIYNGKSINTINSESKELISYSEKYNLIKLRNSAGDVKQYELTDLGKHVFLLLRTSEQNK
ncbi:hypothetical protein [Adhaeribacter rhizoryzae]|uniref:Uncharacterized protein n=1 Tax=Adhaeribacter rhizoryzae TaxID=2607907 RepID=A0A5M6DKC2_9BACT|nr:hypothetical protein [Adhaeribacter rhizoryzae]KAA5546732.1 hypothetical protein F0145_10355 [Adhaeribacter rhizoryzae]